MIDLPQILDWTRDHGHIDVRPLSAEHFRCISGEDKGLLRKVGAGDRRGYDAVRFVRRK